MRLSYALFYESLYEADDRSQFTRKPMMRHTVCHTVAFAPRVLVQPAQ